jgi:glutathione S-transferase
LRERGYQAFDVMEKHLAGREFFVETGYGLADIALYAYTHEAPVGGFDLGAYPAVCEWLMRVEAQPDFVPQVY